MALFGWTLMRWPASESHEARHNRLLAGVAKHRDRLVDAENAITVTMTILGQDLAKIRTLKDQASQLLQ